MSETELSEQEEAGGLSRGEWVAISIGVAILLALALFVLGVKQGFSFSGGSSEPVAAGHTSATPVSQESQCVNTVSELIRQDTQVLHGDLPAGVDPDSVSARYGDGSAVYRSFTQARLQVIKDMQAGTFTFPTPEVKKLQPVIRAGCAE